MQHPIALVLLALATTVAASPLTLRGGYGVSLVTESGLEMQTYHHHGRYYILGDDGERYAIRIQNPTAQRVEAVVTVDGLDVIDGRTGDTRKRGYLIAPYGEITIEGFRTSTSDVAAFRFAPVGQSYAVKKGQGRNVGVIAVALFAEKSRPAPVAVPYSPPPYHHDHQHRHAKKSASRDEALGGTEDSAAPSASASGSPGRAVENRGSAAENRSHPAPRSGLGTEFGERRHSAVTYSQFVRASKSPFTIAEFRYNDAPGLAALGVIPHAPQPDDIYLRETANAFPGDMRFAQPPPY